MLLTTRILSENMAMSTEEYEESLSFLAKTAENRSQDEAKQLYREFIDTQTSFITNLYLEDEQGKLSESVKDVQIVSSQLLTQSSAKNSIYMEKDTDGKIYNVYKRVLKDGRKICPPGAEHKCTERRDIPGSVAFVPSVVGLIIAGEVVKDLCAK